MRVGDLNPANLNGLSSERTSSSQGLGAYGQNGRGAYLGGNDQVQLSGASRVAASALAEHSSRVAHLKALVSAGQYTPSNEAVSKSLVADVLARSGQST